jgi:hypothetical protein
MFSRWHDHRNSNQPGLRYPIYDAVEDDYIHGKSARKDNHDMYRDAGRVWIYHNCDHYQDYKSSVYWEANNGHFLSELYSSKSICS